MRHDPARGEVRVRQRRSRTSRGRRQVRERNFAVLDLDSAAGGERRPAPTPRAPGVAVEKLEGGFHSIAGAAVDSSRHALLRRPPPAADLLVVARGAAEGRPRRAARSGESRVRSIGQPAGAFLGGSSWHRVHVPARVVRATNSRCCSHSLARQRPPRHSLFPQRSGQTGSSGTISTSRRTSTRPTRRCSRAKRPRPYRRCTCRQTAACCFLRVASSRRVPTAAYPGMDETGWRWSHALDAYSLITARAGRACLCHEWRREPYLSCVVARRRHAGRPRSRSRSGAARAVAGDAGATCTSPTGRSSSTAPPGEPIGRIDVPERPTGLRFGGPDGKHAVRALAPIVVRGADESPRRHVTISAAPMTIARFRRNQEEPSGDRSGTRAGDLEPCRCGTRYGRLRIPVSRQ